MRSPARVATAARNFLQRVTDRAALHEQRAGTLTTENIHLRLSLDAALAHIRELQGVIERANALIVTLTPKAVETPAKRLALKKAGVAA